MRVKRNFERIYAEEDDPWSIGEADSDRYRRYVDLILEHSHRRESVLELGCGFGALLSKLDGHFDRLVGVELSARAIEGGRKRYPFIEFRQGSLADPAVALPEQDRFDTIVVSDVLYYLKERDRRHTMEWIARHLQPEGLAFIAGWSPGGRYLTQQEFRNLVERELAVEEEQILDTGHVLFTCRRRRTLVALTVDYETWQPQLPGVALDWNRDVFQPTQRLLDVFDAADATLTIFAEMGEYMWLREHRPKIANEMEQQWRDAVSRGHDVQLHLHPNWLPEMHPAVEDELWSWDMERTRADDYPGDLGEAIGRCKVALETAIRDVKPDYEVIAYRAGTYEAQPFSRLYDALQNNDIWCDSSVLPGDCRADRHYDYSHAYADHQPWFASRYDPQLKAPPAERAIVELPIFTPRPGERWTFDNEEGARFADRLLKRLKRERSRPSSEALRRRHRLRTGLNHIYELLRPARPQLNRMLPLPVARFMMGYERERLASHDYFVLVAHTKTALDFDTIAAGLEKLRASENVEFLSISQLAHSARAELERTTSASRQQEAARQVRREYAAQMSADRNVALSERLHKLLPLDRHRILDAGCGGGGGTAALARTYQWIEVVGADVGEDFVTHARRQFHGDRISFTVQDFASLSFNDREFDCIHADNSLEHAFDVDGTLAELYRVLNDNGCLLAALPPDGMGADWTCDNHTWKTTAADVRARLLSAGFCDIETSSVDIFRDLGLSPFPPSHNRMLYVRAWKRAETMSALDRVVALTRWAYRALDPMRPQNGDDPLAILAGGFAWCWGYALVLGEALAREGFEVHWVTMIAENHPRGVGSRRRDSHEILEVVLDESTRVVCDPMVGVVFDTSLAELLNDPSLADVDRPEDDRYTARNYALYSTSAWYRLVRRVAVRRSPRDRLRFTSPRRLTRHSRKLGGSRQGPSEPLAQRIP